jgi:hypothetical protein
MATALQIINRAAELIGYKDPSETLSGADAANFLASLNDMVDGWNTSRLNVVATTTVTASVTSSPVSVGASQTLNTTRPIRIEGGWTRVSDTDYPLEWITSGEYDAISSKSQTAEIPLKAFYLPSLPYGAIYLWPAPSGTVALHVRVMSQLSAFAALSTDYNLAPGYKKALEYSLAEEIAPGRRPLQPEIARLASNARRAIKTLNHEPLQLEHCGVPVLERFDVRTGE